MKVTVTNYTTKQELLVFRMDNMIKQSDTEIMDAIISEITRQQRERDVLGLNVPCNITGNGFGLGIKSIFAMSYGINTINNSDGNEDFTKCVDNGHSYVLGRSNTTDEPDPVQIILANGDRADTIVKLTIKAEREGFVVNCGKKISNIFGQMRDGYFIKFGSRNVYTGRKHAARLFKNPSDLLKYVKKYEAYFQGMFDTGFCLSVEPVTKDFSAEYWNSLTGKSKAKQEQAWKELNELLVSIEEKSTAKDEEQYFGETPKDEAIRRLRKIGVMDEVVKNFKNDILMQSEAGGVLHYLNENAKIAIGELKNITPNAVPYHVVHSYTTFGDIYAVLYVSTDRDEWEMDGPDKNGYVFSYVYNMTAPTLSEFGSVAVQGLNGGMIRFE